MKFKLLSLLLLLTALLAAHSSFAQTVLGDWNALSDFHGVMSGTFHPAEEGNLAPIKARAGEMAEKANALTAAPIPEAFNTPKVQAAVAKLQQGSKSLVNLVAVTGKSAAETAALDKRILASLSGLHDSFHEIVGLCRTEQH